MRGALDECLDFCSTIGIGPNKGPFGVMFWKVGVATQEVCKLYTTTFFLCINFGFFRLRGSSLLACYYTFSFFFLLRLVCVFFLA